MKRDNENWSPARRFIVGAAATVVALPSAHFLAALLRNLATTTPLAALEITMGAVAAALAGAFFLPRRSAPLAGAAVGAAAAVIAQLPEPGAWTLFPVLPGVGFLVTTAGARFGDRLPSSVDRIWPRRRTVALLWGLLAVVSVVQAGRLATWVADPSTDFVVGTRHPFWYGHQCFSAYLHGAELALWGEENIYDQGHYFEHAENPRTEIEDLWVEDPYQYPPQFLLLPALALRATHDLTTLRVGWFAVNLGLFLAAYGLLARWVGGRGGRLALWLLPAVLASFPFLYTFQFGQFHLATLCLAVLGMLAFAARRRAVGGLLLASAILAKLFPLVLVAPLLVRRRFRDLAWTVGWGAALTLVTLAVFGPQPFVAFADYHLPRLSSGAAFAFDEAFPELADLVVGDNQGVFGLTVKLGFTKTTAAVVGRLFTVGVMLLAAVAGLRFANANRWAEGSLWLALLGLASLASPGAWGDYVPSVAVWLLALVAARAVDERWLRLPLAVTAALQCFLLGTMPIAGWGPPEIMIPVSALGVATMLALFGFVAGSRPEEWAEASDRPSGVPASLEAREKAA